MDGVLGQSLGYSRTRDAAEQLSSKLLDVSPREGLEVVFLEEVVHTHAQ